MNHLQAGDRERIQAVWEKNRKAVSQHETDLGFCDLVHHRIETGKHSPIVKRQWPIPHTAKELMKTEITKMLQMGVIEACDSPWLAPVLLVKKKSEEGQEEKHRFAVDFRSINEVVPRDQFPLPRIETILESLGGAAVFSTLDLKSGYWQIPIAAEDRNKTAFSCGWGTFRFTRMPFGLHNAPATFQRLMQRVLHSVLNKCALVYLDDIIVYSKNLEEHLKHLDTVLELIGTHGLKVSPAKCHLAKPELKFLGHKVSHQGIEVDEDKVKAIREMPAPSSKKEVRSFLGMAGYYRKFIPEFSEVAAPLTKLTKKDVRFEWGNPHQIAFECLKQQLASSPVLAYPRYDEEYKLQTDASNIALGAVLTQEKDGVDMPISYYSRKLNEAETRYTVTEKEALAIVAAVKHFAAYLYGKKFRILTDHAPLRYIFQYKATVPRITRWAVVLAQFDYEIVYKPGKSHHIPDALSRNVAVVTEISENTGPSRTDPAEIFDPSRVRSAQERDLGLRDILTYLEDKQTTGEGPKDKEPYCVQEGCLYLAEDLGEEGRLRLVVPEELKRDALALAHDSTLGGHYGVEKTYQRAKTMFFWKNQVADVREHVRTCELCQKKNPRGQRKAPIGRLPPANEPLERVGIDLIGKMSPSLKGNHYILTIVCHFSRFVQAYAIPDKRTETVADRFLDFVCRYGAPRHVVSDRGSEFTSKVFQGALRLVQARTHLTSAYHPQSNGMTEAFNKLIKNTITPMVQRDPRTWDDQLPCAVAALNSSYHPSIGNSPYFIMHGRDPPLPYSVLLEPQKLHYGMTDGSPEAVFRRLQQAYQGAREASDRAHELNEKYQKQPSTRVYEVGDTVFLRNEAAMRGGYSKFATPWLGPYRITQVLGRVNIEMYGIYDETKKRQVVHVDRVKPAYLRDGTPYITSPELNLREGKTRQIVRPPGDSRITRQQARLASTSGEGELEEANDEGWLCQWRRSSPQIEGAPAPQLRDPTERETEAVQPDVPEDLARGDNPRPSNPEPELNNQAATSTHGQNVPKSPPVRRSTRLLKRQEAPRPKFQGNPPIYKMR